MTPLLVVLLLLCLAGQVVHAIRGQSLTWDEGDHIFSGYQIWKTHDYGLNPEHPPMVKMMGALPLLGLPLRVPALQGRFFKTEAYMDGRELLYRNGPHDGGRYDAGTLIFRARLVPGILALLAGLLVFLAAQEMFGAPAGLLALTLFCFEPNLLAHSAYVTTDMAASCTFFATVYAFWRWTVRPTPARLAVTGLAGGLALAAKHSTVLLLPMLLLLSAAGLVFWCSGKLHAADDPPRVCLPWRAGTLRMLGGLAVIAVLAVGVLWAFYGFRYAARPAGLALAPTLAEYVKPLKGSEAHGILLAGRLHLLPESWLYGLADVRAMANGMPSYFFGHVYAHGVWFYFPTLFLIKSTLGLLALLVLTLVAITRGWIRKPLPLCFLIVPPAVYMLVAMNSHLNIGARHILPIWVFCCVLAGAGAAALVQRGRGWAIAVGVLFALHIGTTLHAAPNYMAYANEAWGGPSHTYRYLSDSNTDWGQQLVATSAWLREHHVEHCYFAYFVAPFVLPSDYGIPCRELPTFDTFSSGVDVLDVPPVIDGPVLVSAGSLNGFEWGSSVLNPLEPFRAQTPVAQIQGGIFVYEGRFAVPLASALGHVQHSDEALKAHDLPRAVMEAQQAVDLAPGAVTPELQLGDSLVATGQKKAADEAYVRAEKTIWTMDPDAQEIWRSTVAKKRQAAGLAVAP